MKICRYLNAKEFLKDYESILLEQESVSQLILYNAYRNKDVDVCEKCMFGAVFDDGPLLLFCNVAPYNLIIFVPENINDKDTINTAAKLLADYINDHNIPISGINARQSICQSFIEQYQSLIPCRVEEKIGMDIMEIREVNDIKPVEGVQRLARLDEVKFITEWMIEFQLEALASEMDYEAALKKAELYIRDNKVYVYEDMDHNVVTMAIVARELVNGAAIAYVYTPHEYRGKGYAVANIYYLSKLLLDQGYKFCTLFVDKKNPISCRAYEKVGYTILEDNYEYLIIMQE
ncbi:MAG: GNAT family N-acetyltransferase [Clostridiales bacterium]|nr:GNAT family N-acetyltransferase [Clostridiales bacterium]